ncbi:MAG: dienelactone hydrolase family protein [Planctomycetaceae bacterium]|nr:dienelactone hydrolase family protein [Planctomycetaceae bacterium]
MSYQYETRSIGPLNCGVLQTENAPQQPKLAVVMCHGFGAPGDDLVGLAPELLTHLDRADHVRFYFPQAPLSLVEMGIPGGRAWWMLDLELLALAAEGKLERDQRDDTPDGMLEAVGQLKETVAEIRSETGLPMNRIVLGGFSQGSMVTTDLALRGEDAPAALIIYSGTLLSQQAWRSGAERRQSLPIIQSHGRQDPILPFRVAEDLRDLLSESGCDVTFLPFDGPHTIPQIAYEGTIQLLQNLLDA